MAQRTLNEKQKDNTEMNDFKSSLSCKILVDTKISQDSTYSI